MKTVRNCLRSVIGGSVAVAAVAAMAGSSVAAINTSKVWEDESLLRPAFSASGDILGDERPELVVSDYGNYQVAGGNAILAPGSMYIYSNGATGTDIGDLADWDRIRSSTSPRTSSSRASRTSPTSTATATSTSSTAAASSGTAARPPR